MAKPPIEQEIQLSLYKPVFADDVLFAIKQPLEEKVQTVGLIFVKLTPIYYVGAVYPVAAADFSFITTVAGCFDSNYLAAVFSALSDNHSVITGKPQDALRRLKYVAEGGTDAFKVPDLDHDLWVILSGWQDWQRDGKVWKDRQKDFETRVGRAVTLSSFQKRCGRLGLSYST
jgi:hypothetical protein